MPSGLEKVKDTLRKTGVGEGLKKIGMTALTGPLGVPVTEALQSNGGSGSAAKPKSPSPAQSTPKDPESDSTPIKQGGSDTPSDAVTTIPEVKKSDAQKIIDDSKPDAWFYKMSKEKQAEYLKEHKHSKFNKGIRPMSDYSLKGNRKYETRQGTRTLQQINDESRRKAVQKLPTKPSEPVGPLEVKPLNPETQVIKPVKEKPVKTRKGNYRPKPKNYRMPRDTSKNARREAIRRQKRNHASAQEFLAEVSNWLDMMVTANRVIGVETAGVEEERMAALRVLYSILLYTMEDNSALSPALRKQVPKDLPEAEKFFDKYKIPKLALRRSAEAAEKKAPYTPSVESWITKLGQAMKSKKLALKKDASLPAVELQMFGNFESWFLRGGETALKNLHRRVNILKDPKLNAAFSGGAVVDTGGTSSKDQTSLEAKLKVLVKKMTNGKVRDFLEPEETTTARTKFPEDYKAYLALRREYNGVAKNFVQDFVRNSGDVVVDYKSLLSALSKAKVKHNLPEGFDGFVDDELNYYTKARKPIKGKPAGAVTMNTAYDPKLDDTYVFIAKTPMGQQHFYTSDFREAKTSQKFENTSALEKNIKAIQKKWLSDMRSKDERTRLMAAMLQIMYQFAARSGTGGGAFGITTLLNKHVKVNGNTATISYVGKKGAAQKHVINGADSRDNMYLVKLLAKKLEEGGKDAPLWTTHAGDKHVPPSAVGRYLKEISGDSNAKLHYVRHILGTKVARDILKKSPLKKGVSQSEAERWYKEAMKEVGVALVHNVGGKITSTTAIKSYIDVELQKQFFKNLGLRIPTWIGD